MGSLKNKAPKQLADAKRECLAYIERLNKKIESQRKKLRQIEELECPMGEDSMRLEERLKLMIDGKKFTHGNATYFFNMDNIGAVITPFSVENGKFGHKRHVPMSVLDYRNLAKESTTMVVSWEDDLMGGRDCWVSDTDPEERIVISTIVSIDNNQKTKYIDIDEAGWVYATPALPEHFEWPKTPSKGDEQ